MQGIDGFQHYGSGHSGVTALLPVAGFSITPPRVRGVGIGGDLVRRHDHRTTEKFGSKWPGFDDDHSHAEWAKLIRERL